MLSGKNVIIFPWYYMYIRTRYCVVTLYVFIFWSKDLEKFCKPRTIYSLIGILYFCHFCISLAVRMEVFMPQFVSCSGNISKLLYCCWTLWRSFALCSCVLVFHFTQVLSSDMLAQSSCTHAMHSPLLLLNNGTYSTRSSKN